MTSVASYSFSLLCTSLEVNTVLASEGREIVRRVENVRACLWAEDLVLVVTPFRMVDGIDNCLWFNNYASVLLDELRRVCTIAIALLLGLLHGYRTVLAVAGIDLNTLLIG